MAPGLRLPTSGSRGPTPERFPTASESPTSLARPRSSSSRLRFSVVWRPWSRRRDRTRCATTGRLRIGRACAEEKVAGFGLPSDSPPEASAPVTGLEPEPDPQPDHTNTRRRAWAKLLARVFEHDVLICLTCGGPRTIIAAVTDLDVAATILEHLGLPTEQPVVHSARAPPDPGHDQRDSDEHDALA